MTGTKISKLLRQINILLIICFCSLSTQAKYGGGAGTPHDPYQIRDANHMQAIGADANDWDKCFKLMSDIDLSQLDGNDGRPKFNIIAPDVNHAKSGFQGIPFSGTFDGKNYTVRNFNYIDDQAHYIGLFGYTSAECVIKNLRLENVTLEGYMYVGGMAGKNLGSVDNCFSEANIQSYLYYAGGLVGENDGNISLSSSSSNVYGYTSLGGLVGRNIGTIEQCKSQGLIRINILTGRSIGGLVGYNSGNVFDSVSTSTVDGSNATDSAGGLVGNNTGIIERCHSNGNVSESEYSAGGLVGYNARGEISHCYATGEVSGTYDIGGLVGWNNFGEIYGSYATGSVYGQKEVGGLTGWNTGGIIINCYSTSDVNGIQYIGGLSGGINRSTSFINYSYATGKVIGDVNTGGLLGYNTNDQGVIVDSFWDIDSSGMMTSVGGTGKTTSEMMQQSTFTDWDFINVWNIGENQTYPYLRTYLAGDINKDGIVNFFDLAIKADQWLEEYYFGNRPPRVLITYPEDGARLMVGGVPPQTMILAEASDYDGSVVRVEFFVDDLKLGEDTDGTDGWSYLWQNYSLGFHVLTAAAWDNEGLSRMSTPVNVEAWMPDPPPP